MSDTSDLREAPRDVLLVLRIVHAAIATSVLVFAGVITMISRAPAPDTIVPGAPRPQTDPPDALAVGLAAAAFLVLIAVLFLRRRVGSAPTPARYTSAAIQSWAATEMIAVFGLVLGIAHRDPLPFLPFGAVSLGLLLLFAPRRRALEAIASGSRT